MITSCTVSAGVGYRASTQAAASSVTVAAVRPARAALPVSPDVTADEATHLLWLLTSFDGFDQLYTGRSLPVDDVSRTLIAAAERSLCR